MKIVYKDTRTVAFKTIAVGDIFSSYDSLYMRTAEVQSTVTGNPYNAVNLENGFFHYFAETVKKAIHDIELEMALGGNKEKFMEMLEQVVIE